MVKGTTKTKRGQPGLSSVSILSCILHLSLRLFNPLLILRLLAFHLLYDFLNSPICCIKHENDESNRYERKQAANISTDKASQS